MNSISTDLVLACAQLTSSNTHGRDSGSQALQHRVNELREELSFLIQLISYFLIESDTSSGEVLSFIKYQKLIMLFDIEIIQY